MIKSSLVLVFICPTLTCLFVEPTLPCLKHPRKSLPWLCSYFLQLPQIYLVLCHFSVKCDFISSANDVWLEGVTCFLCISQLISKFGWEGFVLSFCFSIFPLFEPEVSRIPITLLLSCCLLLVKYLPAQFIFNNVSK